MSDILLCLFCGKRATQSRDVQNAHPIPNTVEGRLNEYSYICPDCLDELLRHVINPTTSDQRIREAYIRLHHCSPASSSYLNDLQNSYMSYIEQEFGRRLRRTILEEEERLIIEGNPDSPQPRGILNLENVIQRRPNETDELLRTRISQRSCSQSETTSSSSSAANANREGEITPESVREAISSILNEYPQTINEARESIGQSRIGDFVTRDYPEIIIRNIQEEKKEESKWKEVKPFKERRKIKL